MSGGLYGDTPLAEPVVVTWDWKEQPPMERIAEVMRSGQPYLHMVPDTGGDQYACVITGWLLTDQEAQDVFDHHDDPDEEDE